MNKDDAINLVEEDGENMAVRSFLMLYSGGASITVGEMRSLMDSCGWPLEYCPDFARLGENAHEYLSKAGAQAWLRHLFSFESKALAATAEVEDGWIPVGERLPPACQTLIVRREHSYYISTHPKECVDDDGITHYKLPTTSAAQGKESER